MSPRFLLDTHIIIRWLITPKKLTREQLRTVREANRMGEPLAISAMTLLEIALLSGRSVPVNQILSKIESDHAFAIIPITVAVAMEVASLGPSLRDPGDRTIVATARVHRLRLITSDQRIVDSNLVSVVV